MIVSGRVNPNSFESENTPISVYSERNNGRKAHRSRKNLIQAKTVDKSNDWLLKSKRPRIVMSLFLFRCT